MRSAELVALDDSAQKPLWSAYRRRGTEPLRRRLHEANLHKVGRIVLKAYPGPAPHLDMIQDAAVEVAKAIDRYDPSKGVPFGAYIHKLVVVQATRTHRRLGTVVKFAHTHGDVPAPVSDACEFEGQDQDISSSEDSPELAALESESVLDGRSAIDRAMAEMDDQERHVFQEHALASPRRSLNDIAEELGISRKWIQPIWNRALERARAWAGAMEATA